MINCLVNLGIYLNLYTKCLLSMWLGNSMKSLFIEISKVSVGGMLGMGFGNDPGSWAGEWMSPGMGDETLTSPVLNLVIFHTVARFIISAKPLTLLWGRKYLGCSCFTLDGKKKKKKDKLEDRELCKYTSTVRGRPWTLKLECRAFPHCTAWRETYPKVRLSKPVMRRDPVTCSALCDTWYYQRHARAVGPDRPGFLSQRSRATHAVSLRLCHSQRVEG